MKKAFTIKVPDPCTENWDQMELREEGRFCRVCRKTVYDFTQFTDQEFIAFFQQQKVSCGRFKKRQLSIEIPPRKKMFFPFGKFPPLAAATLIAAGLSLSAPAQSVKTDSPTHIVIGDAIMQKKPVDLPLLLKGRVLDEHGEAVIGATLIIRGTTTGTVTDADGSFELPATEFSNYTIEVRYLGMVSQTLEIKPGVPVTVKLKIDETDVGEITTYGGVQ